MNIRHLAAASTLAFIAALSVRAEAATVSWADLTSSTATTVSGTIAAPSGNVGVTITGDYAFAQTNGVGTNYWTPTGYTQGLVNAPASSDIVALSDAGSETITFSQAVQNVFVAFNSWNGASVQFDAPFTIVSQGTGYWGTGSFDPTNNNTGFTGDGETVGVLEFSGLVGNSLSFVDTTGEFWHGLTVGVDNVSAVPLPGALPLFGLAMAGLAGFGMRKARKSKVA